jgi:1,2-phenylacetyl-CoA epoxidase PaaB subunit
VTSVSKRYEVFARGQRGGPFYHIGIVEAFSDDLARVLAHHIYDEESWFDMAVVPSDDLCWVIQQGREHVRQAEGA